MARRRPFPFDSQHITRAVRGALLAMACAAGTAGAQTVPAADASATQAGPRKAYSIAAGPLDDALSSFAATAGVSITMPPALVQGRRSPGLQGSYAVREGFARLLAGSGLEAAGGAGGAYALRPSTSGEREGSADGTTLAPVTVTAEADRSGTTEGTGAYITPATAAATGLALAPRDTPQSVTVLTRQQIEDQNMLSLGQAMKSVTGVFAVSSDTDRTDLYARGFYIDSTTACPPPSRPTSSAPPTATRCCTTASRSCAAPPAC